MSTATIEGPVVLATPKVTARGVIRSEWTKFHSLRSTKVVLAVFVLLTLGLSALITGLLSAHWASVDRAEKARFDPALTPLQGIHLSLLAVGVLGVLLISGEYATGMIRSSLTVVPARLPVLRAKLMVFAAAAGVASLASCFGAFFLGQAILSGDDLETTIGNTHALETVLAAATYVVIVGVMGMALGALLRNTAAAISTLAGLFFVVPILFQFLPESWSSTLGPYLPAQAGEAFWGKPDGYAISSPTAAFAVLCAWAVVLLIPAFVRLARSDA
jgi:ABC-2 type transport system permease protein